MPSILRITTGFVLAASALIGGGAVAAEGGPVRVVFAEPERFTDIRDRPLGRVTADDPALAVLSRFVQAEAARRVASGQTLEVRVTDIDRAGNFEPRRGPSFDAVRVVRDVTPPRIDLAFRLLAADGSVLKSGARELRDLQFLSRHRETPHDPMRHEKRLLAEWLARELPQ
jgi:hypothetical protein